MVCVGIFPTVLCSCLLKLVYFRGITWYYLYQFLLEASWKLNICPLVGVTLKNVMDERKPYHQGALRNGGGIVDFPKVCLHWEGHLGFQNFIHEGKIYSASLLKGSISLYGDRLESCEGCHLLAQPAGWEKIHLPKQRSIILIRNNLRLRSRFRLRCR